MSTSSGPSAAEPPFGRVAILGLGLMGGSLARALSALERPPEVVGWSPDPEDRDAASASGAVARVAGGASEAAADADLVVVAAPLGACHELMASIASGAPADAAVTDVVSLKAPVAEAVARAGLDGRWVGSHPMTGGEASGFAASRADLYREATVWTVADRAAEPRRASVHAFWRALEARPEPIGVEEHDRVMALVSHLPQLTSNALATVLERHGVTEEQLGPGGRDATRLAASSPEMRRDLLAHAPDGVSGALRALAAESGRLAELIASGELDEVAAAMARTARWKAGS